MLFQNNQHFQAIEFFDQPVPEKLYMGFLFYEYEVLQVECVDSQVQSHLTGNCTEAALIVLIQERKYLHF